MHPLAAQSEIIETDQREIVNYEISDISFADNVLTLKGWGILNQNQHFLNEQTHFYRIILKHGEEEHVYDASLQDKDLTDLMTYRGYPRCKSREYFSKSCNYQYSNVGFVSNIPLDTLKHRQYEVYLEVKGLQTGSHYRTQLFYPQESPLSYTYQDKTYQLISTYKHMGFQVYYHTLIARKGPSPKTEALSIGTSCSSSYGNDAFFLEGSRYENIFSIHKYQNDITYFHVKARYYGCVNQRVRIVEDPEGVDVYIPSTYVNYTGSPLVLYIDTIDRKPIIEAYDQVIEQYTNFDPNKDVKAYDAYKQDITERIRITNNTVNTRIPGKYEVCYEADDVHGNQARKCIHVTVLKIATRYRYIHKQSQRSLSNNSLWQHSDFLDFLYEALR